MAPLSPEDQHIKDLWGTEATPARLHAAMDDIRFQLGQSDRFRAGLIRSGAWETHIAETLANLGLPAELAVLPHVESSFNPSRLLQGRRRGAVAVHALHRAALHAHRWRGR